MRVCPLSSLVMIAPLPSSNPSPAPPNDHIAAADIARRVQVRLPQSAAVLNVIVCSIVTACQEAYPPHQQLSGFHQSLPQHKSFAKDLKSSSVITAISGKTGAVRAVHVSPLSALSYIALTVPKARRESPLAMT